MPQLTQWLIPPSLSVLDHYHQYSHYHHCYRKYPQGQNQVHNLVVGKQRHDRTMPSSYPVFLHVLIPYASIPVVVVGQVPQITTPRELNSLMQALSRQVLMLVCVKRPRPMLPHHASVLACSWRMLLVIMLKSQQVLIHHVSVVDHVIRIDVKGRLVSSPRGRWVCRHRWVV